MRQSSNLTPPRKPYPEFPLFPHATKRWAKKILQKTCYFGPWNDPIGALNKYLQQKDDLHAGRIPRVQGEGLNLCDLIDRFLTSKKLQISSGELAPRSWRDYFVTCEHVLNVFGKSRLVSDLTPDDFERLKANLAKTRSPVTVGNEVNRVRVLFNWAFEQGLTEKPVRFGPVFRRPPKRVIRLEKTKKGPRKFEAKDLRRIIRAANLPLRAMILLGINAGLGNTDVSNLELRHLDLKRKWLDFPRPKTGIGRRCKLWSETVKAVQHAIADRPNPIHKADNDCVFLTCGGQRYILIHEHAERAGVKVDAVTRDFGKLLGDLKLKRSGLSFYALRHTFETIAGGSRDQVAVDYAMGHADHSMAGVYRQGLDDDRLVAIAEYVHRWLFGRNAGTRQ